MTDRDTGGVGRGNTQKPETSAPEAPALNGWHLGEDGYWHGPQGERLRPISGGQDFDPGGLGLSGIGEFPNVPNVDTSLPNIQFSETGLSLGGGAPIPPAGGSGGGTGGDGGAWGTISKLAKEALPVMQLGTGLLGGYAGIQGMRYAGQQQDVLKRAQQTQQQAAAPLVTAAGQLVPAGAAALQGGPLPPQLEAVARSWANDAKTKIRSAFAHMGITDSQMLKEAEAVVDEQAQVLRSQLAAQLFASGESAAQVGAGAVGGAGATAANQGTAVANAITAANTALAQMIGRT